MVVLEHWLYFSTPAWTNAAMLWHLRNPKDAATLLIPDAKNSLQTLSEVFLILTVVLYWPYNKCLLTRAKHVWSNHAFDVIKTFPHIILSSCLQRFYFMCKRCDWGWKGPSNLASISRVGNYSRLQERRRYPAEKTWWKDAGRYAAYPSVWRKLPRPGGRNGKQRKGDEIYAPLELESSSTSQDVCGALKPRVKGRTGKAFCLRETFYGISEDRWSAHGQLYLALEKCDGTCCCGWPRQGCCTHTRRLTTGEA